MTRALLLVITLMQALSLPLRAEDEREADDPIGRMRSRASGEEGARTPEMQGQILDAASSEALRYGIGRGGRRSSATVLTPGATAWVNIGPQTADFEKNGGTYFKIDSGRARKIVVDPTDANVVYFATSGGGVWKTRDALTPVSGSAGPRWAPITEGIVSLSVGSLAINPANHLSLVLGLGDPFDVQTPRYSILTSDDGGVSWSDSVALTGHYILGTDFTATTVRDIAFDPGGAIVFAATDAGLFRHAGGGVGAGWTLVDLDTATHALQDCWSIAYAGPNTWVASCIDSLNNQAGHLWRSTTDGVAASWTEVTSALGSESSDLGRITLAAAAQASGPWRVYALAANRASSIGGQADQKDFFRSDDGGATWSSKNMHGCAYTPSGICSGEAPQNPTDHQPDLDITHRQASYNQMVAVDPGNADAVFVGGNLSMVRSTDGGAGWTVMTDWLPFALTSQTGGLGDAQYAHADWHAATVARVGGTAYFYGGNDGGLIRAGGNFLTDAPANVTWEDKLNRGIVSHLVYSVASGLERPVTSCTGGGGDIVFGGLQDNGSRLRVLSGGSNYVGYNQVIGGDGFGVAVGCTSGGAMGSQLLSTYVQQISTSSDGGSSFTTRVRQPGNAGSCAGYSTTTPCAVGLSSPSLVMDFSANFHMKVVADLSSDVTYLTPINDNASPTPRGYVYRSTNNGVSFTGINGTTHTEAGGTFTIWPKPMRGVAAHPRAANHYAAVSGGRVYVTTDGGANWYESKRAVSTTSTDYLALYSVAFDPNDTSGNTVWAASPVTSLGVSGAAIPAGAGHLFKCTGTAGVAGGTCLPRSSGIPEAVPVNVVKVDPGDSNTIYAGTEIGLYRSTNGGVSFARYGSGLPLVSVTDVAINANDSAIRVSTFGRGFWEIYPSTSVTAGVAGDGDLDHNGIVDGFDLVREAAIEWNDRTTPDFDGNGDVTFNNLIDESDLAALISKLGGFP